MTFKKYKKALILFGFYIALFIAIGILSITGEESSPFIPGENLGIEFMLIFLVSFILGSLIAVFLGYLLGPLFLFIQKSTTGRKLNYGIQERPEVEKFKNTFRAFFPALMAINLAMLLGANPTIQKIVDPHGDDPTGILIGTTVAMLMFTVPLSIALFAGAWLLIDSGIIHTNKEKLKDSDKPVEVKSVGGVLLNVLKGYAGIGVLFAFYELFLLGLLTGEHNPEEFIALIVLLAPLPIFITIAAIPGIIVLDITKNQRSNYMKKLANTFYRIDDIEVDLTKKG